MNNETNFFPSTDYKIPTTSNYMKFQDGDNMFRVLSSAIVGYEYWNTSNKPVRSQEPFEGMPEDIKTEKDGSHKISHFWAFIVYNYGEKRIQILQLTQKGIMKYMQNLIKNPAWGHPKSYDLVVNRSGSGFDTEYTVVANPPSPVDQKIAEQFTKAKIDLNLLFVGADPFNPEK